MQPIDYTFKAPDPGQAFMQSLIAAQQQRAAQAAAQAKAAEKAEQDRALAELAANPNAGARDYARITARFPGLAEPLKKSFDMLAPEIKQTRINLGYQAVGAVENGKPEVAVSILNRQAEAARGAGDENAAKAYETWGKLIEADPKAASRTVALMLSGVDDKFAENYAKIGGEFRTQGMAPDVARKTAADATRAEADAVTAGAAAAVAPDAQRINLQGQLIDQEFKRESSRLRAIEVAISKETNQLKREELQQKLAEGRAALETKQNEKRADVEAARSGIDNMVSTIDRVLKNPRLNDVLGTMEGRLPAVWSDESADAIALIDTLKSQAFMAVVPTLKGLGALSNAEGEKLQASLQNLDRVQSEQQFRTNLNEANKLILKARKLIAIRAGVSDTDPNSPVAVSSDPRIQRLMRDAGLSEAEAAEFLKQRK